MISRKQTAKAKDTRRRILETALVLFRRRGFEETTMRAIAEEAGMATGAAYYYFESKDSLVAAFYEEARVAIHDRVNDALQHRTTLRERLTATIEIKFEYFASQRDLLRTLFSRAADPAHPLSPFGEQTREIREEDIEHFHQAIAASDFKTPADLMPVLPTLLWLYQMGLILFWIYDRSEEQKRSRRMFESSLDLLVSMLKLARLPVLRPIRRKAAKLAQTAIEE